MTATAWWILGFVLLAAEMATGTFYLLILGLTALIAGGAAFFGVPPTGQWLCAIAAATVGSVAVNRIRARRGSKPNPIQDLDVGQAVTLIGRSGTEWRVRYRGSEWQAELVDEPDLAAPSTLYIRGKQGNRLIVSARPPQS